MMGFVNTVNEKQRASQCEKYFSTSVLMIVDNALKLFVKKNEVNNFHLETLRRNSCIRLLFRPAVSAGLKSVDFVYFR